MIVVAAKFSRGIKGTRYSRKNSEGLGAATSALSEASAAPSRPDGPEQGGIGSTDSST